MKKERKILLIIPAYNEEGNILKTYNKVVNYNKKNKEKYDVIVINDGSTDNTSKICHDNGIPVVDLVRNLGIGGAVQTGYKYALKNGYDIAVQFDGDGQHDVNYIKNIIEPILKKEADLVIGSRFIDKSSSSFKSTFSRRAGISLISFVIKLKKGKKIFDTTSGFRAANKDVIGLFTANYPIEFPEPISTISVLQNNFKVEEVAVSMNKRETGKSSISSWKNVYYMINVILSILLMKRGK